MQDRLHAILNEFIGSDGKTLPGTHTAVSTAYLTYADDHRDVRLKMYPADTLEQAREFYRRPNIVQRILTLEREGWRVAPNFHFGYVTTGLCWTTVTRPLAEYMSYWQNNIENTEQIRRPDWNEYWDKLLTMNIVERGYREEFDHDFTNASRDTATPRPGIACTFVWSLDEAEQLDAKGQLTKAVKERINQLLEALGEEEIDQQ
jgi:hypothetical protein